MGDRTKIEWTDATWNPVTGCTLVSEGCRRCYAARLAATRLKDHPTRRGLARVNAAGEAKFTGELRFNALALKHPLHWRAPRRIFVNAHSDTFHEDVPVSWLDRTFAIMADCPQHVLQVLTKRSARMRAYINDPETPLRIARWLKGNHGRSVEEAAVGPIAWPLRNVWLGVSAEDQANADARVPDLLATQAAVRFLSAEPLLGPIDARAWLSDDDGCEGCDDGDGYGHRCGGDDIPRSEQCPKKFAVFESIEHGPFEPGGCPAAVTVERITLDWVIVGGESGPKARPMHPDWARSLRDQCAAGVAFFFKQWGEWLTVYDRDREDPEWRRCDVIQNETPKGQWLNAAGGMGFHGDRVVRVDRIGKRAAGRNLDCIEHNAMPGRAA